MYTVPELYYKQPIVILLDWKYPSGLIGLICIHILIVKKGK